MRTVIWRKANKSSARANRHQSLTQRTPQPNLLSLVKTLPCKSLSTHHRSFHSRKSPLWKLNLSRWCRLLWNPLMRLWEFCRRISTLIQGRIYRPSTNLSKLLKVTMYYRAQMIHSTKVIEMIIMALNSLCDSPSLWNYSNLTIRWLRKLVDWIEIRTWLRLIGRGSNRVMSTKILRASFLIKHKMLWSTGHQSVSSWCRNRRQTALRLFHRSIGSFQMRVLPR